MEKDSIPPSPPKQKKNNRFRLVLLLLTLIVLVAVYAPLHRLQAESLLRRSLLHSEIEGVREALNRGADPNLQMDPAQAEGHLSLDDFARLLMHRSTPPDPNAKTALMFAANNSHADIVEALLQHGADVNRLQDGGYSALLYASSKASPAIVETLLKHGADVKAQNREGITPLLNAVRSGQLANVRLLLAKGADLHAVDKQGETVLSLAVENPFGSIHTPAAAEEIVRYLLAQGADERDLPPAHLALVAPIPTYAPGDAIPVHPVLVYSGGYTTPPPPAPKVQKPTPTVAPAPPPPFTPLLYAAKYGNLTLLKFLWERADGAVRQQFGTQALSKAVASRRTECVQFLLDQHVPVNASPELMHGPAYAGSIAGYTPLHYAVSSPNGIPLARLLLAHGADVNAAAADGTTPLLIAADSAYLPGVQLLLTHGANVHAVDSRTGRNALIRSANRTELVRLFLDHGLDVNARDSQGRTALMHCFTPLNASILLEHGANVNLQDREGNTALMLIAREASSPNLITLLLQHGAQVDARNSAGATALMQCRDPQNGALLIAQGAQVNLQDAKGDTPLTYAIREIPQRHGTDFIAMLLKHGAGINVPNHQGETPLSLVKRAPQATIVIPLLNAAPAKK